MITESENLKDTALWWLSPMQRSGFIIYWLLIFLFLACATSLFFIRVDLSVRAQGIIRPGPDGALMGECFVSTKDIGLLNKGQQVMLDVDAFNYNYFGAVTTSIYSIDNDFIEQDKTSFFKVKCRLQNRILKLSNGYAGELKKGMGFQARFLLARRSLWQLLYQRLNDWLDPVHRF
jgi:hypothetical protein